MAESNMPFVDQSNNPNYAKITTDIPLEQPMRFILGHVKASYLPHEDTDDESIHYVPQQVVDQITTRRVLQAVQIRLGDAKSFKYLLYFTDGHTGLPADLSVDKMFSFRGTDHDGHTVISDEGFDTTHASIGEIDWTPPDEVALTPGFYKTAQFVIESEDRTVLYATLDFSLLVINNNVAWPRPVAFYLSEYLRGLNNLHQMQNNADSQISYLLNYADNVIDGNLRAQAQKVAAALNTIKNNIEQIETDFQQKINEFSQLIITFNDSLKSLEHDTDNIISQERKFETELNTKEQQFESLLTTKEQQLETNIIAKQQQLENQLKVQEQAFETDLTQKYVTLKQQQDAIANQIIDNKIVTTNDIKQEVAKQIALISAQEDVQGSDLQEFLDKEGKTVNTTPQPPDDSTNTNDHSGSDSHSTDSGENSVSGPDDLIDSTLREFLNQNDAGYQDSNQGPEGDIVDLGLRTFINSEGGEVPNDSVNNNDDIADNNLKEFVTSQGGN